MQRMGGINSIAIAKDQTHTLSVGQEKKLVVWNNVENDLITQVSLDEENDEGHSIAM